MREKKLKVSCANGQTDLRIQMAPYDKSGFKVTEVPFELVEYKGGYFKIRSNEGGYGIADVQGRVIVEPVWEDMDILCGADGTAQAFTVIAKFTDPEYGLVSYGMRLLTTEGEQIADLYDVKWAGANEGLAVVYQESAEYGSGFWRMGGVRCFDLKEKRERFCYLDDYFKHREWEEVFHDGLLRVPYKNRDGEMKTSYSTFLDKDGKEVHTYVLSAKHSSEGKIVAGVQRLFRNDQYGAFDSTASDSGLKGKYDSMEPYRNGFAVVSNKGKFGFVDKNFKVSAELVWDRLDDLQSDGLAFAKKGDECALVDSAGRVRVELRFDTDGYCGCSEDSYLLKQRGGGYIIMDGKKHRLPRPYQGVAVRESRGMHRGLIPMLLSRRDDTTAWNVYDCAGNAVLDTDDSFQPADTGLGFSKHCIYEYGRKRPAHYRRRLPSLDDWGDRQFEQASYEVGRYFGTVFEPFRMGQWLSGDSERVAYKLEDYFDELELNGLKREKTWRLDENGSEILFFNAVDREGLSGLLVTVDERTEVNCDFMAIIVREGEETRFRFVASREFMFN